MLQVTPNTLYRITGAERKDNGLYLTSKAQNLRILPVSNHIIRITCTTKDHFEPHPGVGIQSIEPFADWSYTEDDERICLKTDLLNLSIQKATGAISYYDRYHHLLLAECDDASKILDEFDSYKTVIDQNAQIRQVQTADGKKNVIDNAHKVWDKKLYHTTWNLTFQEEEVLYGLGQHEEGWMNLRGTTQYLHQANMKIAIPMLLSSKGYGLLVPTGSPAVFSDAPGRSYFYTEADLEMNYYFIYGPSLDTIVQGYRRLSGKAGLLPRWAFGYVQSQERYENQTEILDTVAKMRRLDFGIDTIVLDWMSWEGELWGQKTFDRSRFPDPTAMTRSLHDMDVHFMLSIWPNMAADSENGKEMAENDLLFPGSEIYNAFDPAGRALYWKQTEKGLFHHGIDAWWCDSNEPIAPEWSHSNKPVPPMMYQEYVQQTRQFMPAELCNAYGLYHAQALYEGQRGTGSHKRVVNLTRNGYIGSQKYNVILWSGDISASWDTYRHQIVSGLQFCASGLPYWTLDIGAFFVKKGMPWYWNGCYEEGLKDLGYRELYTRWYQYGAFLPIFRSHGTDVRREPWHYGEPGDPFYEALKKANHLRYRLLAYIYSCAGHVWKDDRTLLRMLAFDFAEDPKALTICDQFMLGPSLMVCPVTVPMYYDIHSKPLEHTAKTREVYLPKGADWYDYYTDTFYTGGQTLMVDAPIDHIPLFIKSGSIIPVSEGLRSASMLMEKGISMHIYPGADGELTLYEDQGDGYDYETGAYSIRRFLWDDRTQTLTQEAADEQEWMAPILENVIHFPDNDCKPSGSIL